MIPEFPIIEVISYRLRLFSSFFPRYVSTMVYSYRVRLLWATGKVCQVHEHLFISVGHQVNGIFSFEYIIHNQKYFIYTQTYIQIRIVF